MKLVIQSPVKESVIELLVIFVVMDAVAVELEKVTLYVKRVESLQVK